LLRVLDHVSSAEVEDGIILLDMFTGDYYGLNATATQVWQMVEQNEPLEMLVERLCTITDMPSAEVRLDIEDCIRDFIAAGLIVDEEVVV
jgi:hypothetical protein